MSDAAAKNRAWWNATSDAYQETHAEQLAREPRAWGVWAVHESSLGLLPEVEGRDVLELGCGGAQWSIALEKAGARAVGLDASERQLAHARRARRAEESALPLVHGNAECLPFDDACFDLVFCDHGATSFARPELAVAEASRVLRHGGWFVFNIASPIVYLCWDERTDAVGETLQRDYFGFDTIEDDDGQVSFQLPYGDWIRLFRRHGFAVEDLVEIQPTPDATTSYEDFVSHDWARRWPAENVWKLRREAS